MFRHILILYSDLCPLHDAQFAASFHIHIAQFNKGETGEVMIVLRYLSSIQLYNIVSAIK